jgi:hypothetical protein
MTAPCDNLMKGGARPRRGAFRPESAFTTRR